MRPKLALLLAAVIVLSIVLGVAGPLAAVVADDTEPAYAPKPTRPPATPGPHFAYQQAQLAQATGVARLDLPAPTESSGPPRGALANAVMPTPLPQARQVATAIGDVIVDAKRANPQLSAGDVRAVVQEGDMLTILVECNCSPKPLLIGSMAPDTPVKYLTFRVDRRYLGHRITAGPETAEIRELIARSPGLPPGFR